MYSLFEVFGVELEYMIVGSDSLEIKAIADKILIDDNNNVSADVLRDAITWSNELANHVIELKTSVPIKTLEAIDQDFSLNICEINKNLAAHNALLLSGACHPFMNPKNDCYLWQHEGNEIYALYHKLFDCRAHGWVNLQSVHLNLPFSDENEFSRLHSAIRIILPLLPAIAASSPILMSKYEKIKDMRLHYYVNHQTKVKSTLGEIIPDLIQSQVEYEEKILNPISADIKNLNCEGILDPVFFNARAAIARFDRGSIEIRLLDIQESPLADISVLQLIIETLKDLVFEAHSKLSDQTKFTTKHLKGLLDQTIIHAEDALLDDPKYIDLFGFNTEIKTAKDLWNCLLERHANKFDNKYCKALENIVKNGTLSTRIVNNLQSDFSKENILSEYLKLSQCLSKNELYY